MRITNNTPYSQQHTSSNRAAIFKRKFKAGQVLKGKLLRMENHSLAWVLIGGMELLAQIETTPQQGQWMEFLVLTLEPSIILRQLQHGRDLRSTVFLRDYIRSYLTERDKLDAMLHATLWSALPQSTLCSLSRSHAAFCSHLAEQPEHLAQCTRVMRLLTNVQHMVTIAGHGSFTFMPWLAPHAKGVELLISASGDAACTVTVGAVFPPSNSTVMSGQLKLAPSPAHFAYRLLLEKNCKASNNSLQTAETSFSAACLGTQELPTDAHDILSMIFKESPQQHRGLNLQA
ncbi:MAG: hypothetical protein MI749_07885 [Desulfovibrionales bacterium]|nr:hypothetical protein [Desulfovibrionales bacterium]